MEKLDIFTDFFVGAQRDKECSYVRSNGILDPDAYFTLKRFQELLENPLLSPDWLQVALKGQALSFEGDYLWKTVQNRKLCFIDKKRMDEAIGEGASVVLEGLDILDPRIHSLCAEIDAQLPCALINCEAFFSQRGNEAYHGHRDSDDVLVIQIEGKKRWRIHAPQQRSYRGNSPMSEQQMGPLLTELVMEPGDVLFVRAGVPHRCITETDISLHLSFDLCDRTPNIEQITYAANQSYAQSLAPMNASVDQVVDRYIEQLNSELFRAQLAVATAEMKEQTIRFRSRMESCHRIKALDKWK